MQPDTAFKPENRKITVDAKCFLAAWQFVSDIKNRPYINGVNIEKHPDGGALLIACTGPMLTVIHDDTASIEGDESWLCQTPNNINRELNKRNGASLHFVGNSAYVTTNRWAEWNSDGASPDILTEFHTAVAWAPPVNLPFPNWRGILNAPSEKRHHAIALDGALIGKITKAVKLITPGNKPEHQLVFFTPPDDKTPALVRTEDSDQFFALIMPMSCTGEMTPYPLWLPAPEPAKPAAANDGNATSASETKPSAA